MNCPKCSFENRDGSKYCNECGHPLPQLDSLPSLDLPSIAEPSIGSAVSESASFADHRETVADFSGLERMVDEGYVPPAASWRSGNTAEMPRLSDEPRRVRSFSAPEEEIYPPRSGIVKKAAVGFVLLAALVALLLFATYSMEIWGGKTVPDVVGRSHTDALYLLESKGFEVRSTEVKSDDVEGIVLLMDPAGDSRQEVGSEVVIHVSVPRIVPEIVNIPRLNAANLLKDEGFSNVTYVEVKSNEHEGLVLSVSPEEGTKATAGTPIVIEVAVPYTVPEVAGLTSEEAVSTLEAEGYVVSVSWMYSEEVEEGLALVTEPVATTKLAAGSPVTLYLAKSRANELLNATKSYLSSQELFVIDGATFSIDASRLQLTYEGDDAVRYKVFARRAETHFWELTGEYETKYGAEAEIEGLIFWDENTNVEGGDPTIYRAG